MHVENKAAKPRGLKFNVQNSRLNAGVSFIESGTLNLEPPSFHR